jgi:molybdate transport system ATP-binding protein
MLNLAIQLKRGSFTLDVTLNQSARVTGVFGPSGAGKSSLLHIIAGLATPDRGRVELDGIVLFDSASRINVPAHRRRIGFMFQDDRLFPHLNVERNLRYGMRKAATRSDGEPVEFDRLVDLLELRPLLGRDVANLSGGERQRIALGRSLLSGPRLLLLDEPLSSLDVRLRRQIIPYLKRVRDASVIPMLHVSHDLTEILQLTDELLVLDRGRVAGFGRFRELARRHEALDVLHDSDLTNVLEVTVMAQHPHAGITEVTVSSGALADMTSVRTDRLAVPYTEIEIGWPATIAIHPREVSLSAARVANISIRNQLPGRITAITTHHKQVLVEVALGEAESEGPPLVAEVSLQAAASLELQPGKMVWCLVKSNAIRWL